MRQRNLYSILALILIGMIVLSSLPIVEATRARIGNARMVLRAPVGDVLERFILTENANEYDVRVELNAVGGLADNVVIKDSNFTLVPGEQKRAYFTIFASEAGSTETKVVVSFTPIDSELGNKASIASRVFFITEGEGSSTDNTDSSDTSDQNSTDTNTDASGSANSNTVGVGFAVADSASAFLKSPSFILIASTIILIIILIILAIIYYKNKENKGQKKENQKGAKTKPKKRAAKNE